MKFNCGRRGAGRAGQEGKEGIIIQKFSLPFNTFSEFMYSD